MLTITAVTKINVNGTVVEAGENTTVDVTGNTTITINKEASLPETYEVTVTGDAVETTDYTISGADDLDAVEEDTELTITAVTKINVNGTVVEAGENTTVDITGNTTITINTEA